MYPVVGYPKSGGTWMCKLLAHALDLPFAQTPFLPVAMPCILHGHWRYHRAFRGVTCTVRDGRDIMVSYYHYCKLQYSDGPAPPVRTLIKKLYGHNPDLTAVRENLPRFIEYVSRHPIGTRLNWSLYCADWEDRPGVVTVRYERMIFDPAGELQRVLGEHGRSVAPSRIAQALDVNSMVSVTGRQPGQEDEGAFIRKGVVGDWRSSFSDESCEMFASQAGDTLVQLGYESSADWRHWKR